MQRFCTDGPTRAILFLADPFGESGWLDEIQKNCSCVTALIFHESERCLHHCRQALWELRRKNGWVCVAAEGKSAAPALALAAQLPVDRLALRRSALLDCGYPLLQKPGLPRQLAWAASFARRNLSLVASEILMIDSSDRELRSVARGRGHCRNLRSLHTQTCGEQAENWQELLLQPWENGEQNRLRIPWKCV